MDLVNIILVISSNDIMAGDTGWNDLLCSFCDHSVAYSCIVTSWKTLDPDRSRDPPVEIGCCLVSGLLGSYHRDHAGLLVIMPDINLNPT